METRERHLIIAASGKGLRMNSDTPKQFVEINGKPVIVITLDAFKAFVDTKNTIVVIAKNHQNHWDEIIKNFPEYSDCKIVFGGPTRFHSIKAGLGKIPGNSLLAIHDAVRPLVNEKVIDVCFKLAEIRGTAVPAVEIEQSVRETTSAGNKAVDRAGLRLVQTPQIFKSEIVKEAYRQVFKEKFTDDATVVENDGHKIFLTKGNKENIKITDQSDLEIATVLLSKKHTL
jgi:2-C-methyl-D-erythritol 4-phosphate cytidylyltransferase